MRIKFKAIGEHGGIIYGLPNLELPILNTGDNRYMYFDEIGGRRHLCLKESITQFTGLVDKNGTEIYDKDQFKANVTNWVYEVAFNKGAFGYYPDPDTDLNHFVSFSENFANLKGKGNQMNAVEVITSK